MDIIKYFKDLGPNFLTPRIIRYGYIMPGVAYEVAWDPHGLDHKPLYAVTVAREVTTDDGGTRVEMWHDKSEAFKSVAKADKYIVDLIMELDPEEPDPGVGLHSLS